MLLIPKSYTKDWQIEIKLECEYEKCLIIRSGNTSFVNVYFKRKQKPKVTQSVYGKLTFILPSEKQTKDINQEKSEEWNDEYLTYQFMECIQNISAPPLLIPPSRACITDFSSFLLNFLFLLAINFKKNIDIPLSLPGLYKELMSFILNPNPIKASNEQAEKAKENFKKLFGFEIYQERTGLKFRDFQLNVEGNITFASSSIKELLPIYLILDRGFKGNLFIEEPEAHLHPWNQIKMAYFLTALVNLGYNLVVTSHSDFLVSSIGSLVSLNALRETKPSKFRDITNELPLRIEEEYLISPDKISVYWFKLTEKKVEVEQIDINKDGIPLSAFEEPTNFLFDLTEMLGHMGDQ
jgi:hypothetical protein